MLLRIGAGAYHMREAGHARRTLIRDRAPISKYGTVNIVYMYLKKYELKNTRVSGKNFEKGDGC